MEVEVRSILICSQCIYQGKACSIADPSDPSCGLFTPTEEAKPFVYRLIFNDPLILWSFLQTQREGVKVILIKRG